MIKMKNNKGLTLIEIVIALAILGIILVSYVTIFSNSFISILLMGQKSQAVSDSQSIIEVAYDNIKNITGTYPNITDVNNAVQGSLTSGGYEAVGTLTNTPKFEDYTSRPSDIGESNTNEGKIRYSIEAQSFSGSLSDVRGYKITVLTFYSNYKKYVKITSFVPERG